MKQRIGIRKALTSLALVVCTAPALVLASPTPSTEVKEFNAALFGGPSTYGGIFNTSITGAGAGVPVNFTHVWKYSGFDGRAVARGDITITYFDPSQEITVYSLDLNGIPFFPDQNTGEFRTFELGVTLVDGPFVVTLVGCAGPCAAGESSDAVTNASYDGGIVLRAVAVPEPGVLTLAFGGLAALGVSRRMRRKSVHR